MNQTKRQFLCRLRDSESKGLPKSQIPAGCADLVQALETCGAAEFRPASRGRGFVFRISDIDTFNRFVGAHLPSGLNIDSDRIADRASAVAMLADAKAVRQSIAQPVFVRAAKPDIVLRSEDNENLCVSEITQRSGAACVKLSTDERWMFSGRIAVIENSDSFWQSELVLPDIDLAILSGGRMSHRLVAWLGCEGMRECQILHWGDYDPVGICEFVRLADAYPDRVTSYAPDDVDRLLPRFGKPELITKQSRFLDRLRHKEQMPHVSRMLRLFDTHRRGLEQELLLHLAKFPLEESHLSWSD